VQQRHLPIWIAQTVKFVEIAKMYRLILDVGEGGRLVGRVAWNDSFLLPDGGRPRIRVKTTQSDRFFHVSWAYL